MKDKNKTIEEQPLPKKTKAGISANLKAAAEILDTIKPKDNDKK
jgi:hypothetical protein